MRAFDNLSREDQQHVLAEYREVTRLMQRYNISQEDATALRLGIIRGEIPPPDVADLEGGGQ